LDDEKSLDLIQETALNHVKTAGLLGDGFGSTPEMSKRNLFWVVSQMQAIVELYPCWYGLQHRMILFQFSYRDLSLK